MNRRSFFSGLLGAAPVAVVAAPKALDRSIWAANDRFVVVEGWTISWTGWKADCYGSHFAGQWIAIPMRHGREDKSRHRCYSSTPGVVSVCYEGDVFNGTPQVGQTIVEPHTPESVRTREQGKALQRLLDYIKDGPRCGLPHCQTCYPEGKRNVAVVYLASDGDRPFDWCSAREARNAKNHVKYFDQFHTIPVYPEGPQIDRYRGCTFDEIVFLLPDRPEYTALRNELLCCLRTK